jgi:hypothetical protein
MKNWEDIVKDKLEGYESTLPEGSLADFRARRDAAGRSTATRRSPLIWIVPAAVAASLAAFLFLRNPGGPEEGSPTIQQPGETIAVITEATETTDGIDTTDSAETAGQTPSQNLIAQAVTPRATSQPAVTRQETEPTTKPATQTQPETQPETRPTTQQGTESTKPSAQTDQTDQTDRTDQSEQAAQTEPDAPTQAQEVQPTTQPSGNTVITPNIPYFPEVSTSKSIRIKVGPAVGIVAGGGLLAAASPYLIALVKPYQLLEDPSGIMDVRLAYVASLSDAYYGAYNSDIPDTKDHSYPTYPPGQIQIDPKPKNEYAITDAEHSIPLKMGLSARIPVSERLSVATGLVYSLYSSDVSLSYKQNYRYDYKRSQHAHYLGIPIRLDWMLASGKWLDVYLGGGFQGDYCLGATLNWDKIDTKDGLTFSLLGAGGVQFNINERVGIYAEPELSWTPYTKNLVLATYRKDNPLMFTVATGLRIRL